MTTDTTLQRQRSSFRQWSRVLAHANGCARIPLRLIAGWAPPPPDPKTHGLWVAGTVDLVCTPRGMHTVESDEGRMQRMMLAFQAMAQSNPPPEPDVPHGTVGENPVNQEA